MCVGCVFGGLVTCAAPMVEGFGAARALRGVAARVHVTGLARSRLAAAPAPYVSRGGDLGHDRAGQCCDPARVLLARRWLDGGRAGLCSSNSRSEGRHQRAMMLASFTTSCAALLTAPRTWGGLASYSQSAPILRPRAPQRTHHGADRAQDPQAGRAGAR